MGRHGYYLSLTAIHFGTLTFMQGDTFQCMINHEQILFFHLRVMESKFDNAPNETNSMKTKKKHFYSFSFFHVSERSEM